MLDSMVVLFKGGGSQESAGRRLTDGEPQKRAEEGEFSAKGAQNGDFSLSGECKRTVLDFSPEIIEKP